jgi:hypothetical protein
MEETATTVSAWFYWNHQSEMEVTPQTSTAMFHNHRVAARYRHLASISPGSEVLVEVVILVF